jgi:hypothetical protein
MLSLFNLPCAGFCETSELLTVPRILIGNRQLLPGATPMSPVEFSPQSASVIDVEQSEAARTKDTGSKPVTSTASDKATTLYNHVANLLVFIENPLHKSDQKAGRHDLLKMRMPDYAYPARESPVHNRKVRAYAALGGRQAVADFSTLR